MENIGKIKTGVIGLDDLFYGGLRLPNNEQGLVIAIYGGRGISKHDLALQIMYGVKHNKWTQNTASIVRCYDFIQSKEVLMKKYLGFHIGRTIADIRNSFPQKIPKCDLCDFFYIYGSVLRDTTSNCIEMIESNKSWKNDHIVSCSRKNRPVYCDLCKLLRHEIVNYNERTQALHWTISDQSNDANLLASCYKKSDKSIEQIFPTLSNTQQSYQSTAVQRFKNIQQSISGDYSNLKHYDAIAIGGFTVFDDILYRLPFEELTKKLREKSDVSILVFDERAPQLHLNVDIMIEMRSREDIQLGYTFHELSIVKSDLQQHVYGWHRYKKHRDLSIEVFPSVYSLMSKRFASSYALPRLERDTLLYPQSLLTKFQNSVSNYDDNTCNKQTLISTLDNLHTDKKDKGVCYDSSNDMISVRSSKSSSCLKDVDEENDILCVLLGRNEQRFRAMLHEKHGENNPILKRTKCWEVKPGCISPEEILSVLKQYMINWWNNPDSKRCLYLYIDDISQLGFYPLVEREPLFLPALLSICNDVCNNRDLKSVRPDRKITIHLVCPENHVNYRYVRMLELWNATYNRDIIER